MAAPRTVWRNEVGGWLGAALRAVGAETQDGGGVVPGRMGGGVEEFLDPAEAEDWAAELRDRVAVDRDEARRASDTVAGWIT